MDKLFEKGIFSDEVEMLVEILKLRLDLYLEKFKPVAGQKLIGKKIKLNSIDVREEENLNAQENLKEKITLEVLVR
jgi:hypothetical protein